MIISRPQSGKVRTRRNFVMSFLVMLFLGAPWVVLPSGTPLVRLDIPHRMFHLFGGLFIPQEGLILWFFLLTMGLSLFFFTSVIGRVWCGWGCPQTIYTDLFDRIGRAILDSKYGKKDAPALKKYLVYTIWMIISFIASFHWIGYFVSPYTMAADFANLTFLSKTYPLFIGFFTIAMFVDIGFIREQFCKYACPYARFQTILMDEHSWNVTYDYKRGEPRRDGKSKIGDCISCNMCVVVCPTGIDIRDGLQVGCVACGKCVDACTSIMAKENKKTLIGYFSLDQIETKTKVKWVRPRTVIYAILLTIVVSAATYKLITRVPMSMIAAGNKSMPPILLPDNKVRAFVALRIQNIAPMPATYVLEAYDTRHHKQMLIRSGEGEQLTLNSGEIRSFSVVLETQGLSESELKEKYIPGMIRLKNVNDPDSKIEKVLSLTLPGN
ncbi:cytochrome c oxidase accessory protein CcoG [Leptospira ognonensis]|uniref:Cytochrome c oxidase accessory protein CcoG n=1 Tax=Leptospira ognonensis TaxID=2484945 RepID=A0A4R9K8Q8_9LEPT|nr:cytochrome c oxidase accessory protein CcoG [Leptospira ognonensis]TGL61790.1 cytochrome c oxidase accessory protein CcoG [Leptospira ognonensis]